MKILHYLLGLPPVRAGGLVKYALDLAQGQLDCGNKIALLIPGTYEKRKNRIIKIKKGKYRNLFCYQIINSLPVSGGESIRDIKDFYEQGNKEVYMSFLESIRPDVIHIHTFMGLHLSFLKAAKELNIPTLYTTHDYYGLCPVATLYRSDMTICDGNWDNCSKCMGTGVSTTKLVRKQTDIYRMLKKNPVYHWLEYARVILPVKQKIKGLLEKDVIEDGVFFANSSELLKKLKKYYQEMFRYVTFFHFNSYQTEVIFRQLLGKINGKVLYLSNRCVSDRRKIYNYGKILRIGFISYDRPFKGFSILRKALDELYESGMTNLECHVFSNIYGEIPPYVISHKPYSEKNISKAYSNFDVLVQPSLCKETFGLTVLEALSFGIPVIISENVGAKEIVGDMGIIVRADKDGMKEVISSIYRDREILIEKNRLINSWEVNFDFVAHIRDMLELYKEMIKG